MNLTTTNGAGHPAAPIDPFDGFELLTKYEDAPEARPDFIACISAGFKNAAGNPEVSRDGTIHISDPSDRAPGLAAALAEGGGKVLTITLPSDRLGDCFFQHYRKEGKSRLEAHGDANGITTIAADGSRQFYPAGSPEFKRIVEDKATKVTYEIAFFLARWDLSTGTPRPEVYWPDGLGAYRVRSTSPKTANNFLACIRQLSARTGGPVAGFPLEVRLIYPKVADPTGTKRAVPLFSFTVKPPGGVVMDAGAFRAIALDSAALLPSTAIAALPPAPTLDEVIAEFDAELLTVPLDAAECRKGFFGITGKTHWGTDEGRAELLGEFTKGKTTSRKTFLEGSTEDDRRALLDFAQAKIDAEAAATGADVETGEVIETTAEVVEADEDPPAPPVDPDANKEATKAQIDESTREMKRIGWGQVEGKAYLSKTFRKESRLELTRAEITQFINYLKGLQPAATTEEEGDA
jgi:hypothetical protein